MLGALYQYSRCRSLDELNAPMRKFGEEYGQAKTESSNDLDREKHKSTPPAETAIGAMIGVSYG